jgi:hypothetical protein
MTDFDIEALYRALDEQRRTRGLSWPGVAHQINATFADVKSARPMAVSSMTGMRSRTFIEGNVVLLQLRWLDRTPESFVPGHPAPTTPETTLPHLPTNRILRWDPPALHAALDASRRAGGLTWKQVADEIPGFTPRMLTELAGARHVAFPQVMRLVAWLNQPAVNFTEARSR